MPAAGSTHQRALLCPPPRSLVAAVRTTPGYSLPSYTSVAGSLLDDMDTRIQRAAQPLLQRSNDIGCCIVMDGWSDAAANPLINALAINPRGAYFLFAENTTGQRKTGAYLAQLAGKAIDAVGRDCVVAVIADSAASNVAAGEVLEAE
jgi:hypothetical protein